MYSGWQLITRLSGGILQCWWFLTTADKCLLVSSKPFHQRRTYSKWWVPSAWIGCDCENLTNTVGIALHLGHQEQGSDGRMLMEDDYIASLSRQS